jgi:hypothetical protein
VSIKTISSCEVYRNPWARVREDVIERANGVRGIYGVMDKDPACIVIPLETTAEGEFLHLVEQFRYAVQATFKEFPQGGWEQAEVDPEQCGRNTMSFWPKACTRARPIQTRKRPIWCRAG